MGKSAEPTVPIAEPAVAASTFAVSLDEFCRRLSAKKASPELISGFHHLQSVANNLRDSDAAYTARFAAFVKQPA